MIMTSKKKDLNNEIKKIWDIYLQLVTVTDNRIVLTKDKGVCRSERINEDNEIYRTYPCLEEKEYEKINI